MKKNNKDLYSEIYELKDELFALKDQLSAIQKSVPYRLIAFLKKHFPFFSKVCLFILKKLFTFYKRFNQHLLFKKSSTETKPVFLKLNNKHLKFLRQRTKENLDTNKKSNIALVTAIVNEYDNLLIPNIIEDNVDYICFTNTPLNNYGIWNIKPIPYFHQNPTKISRFVKLNLHLLLSGYDFVIWKDANININKSCDSWVKEVIKSKKSFGVIRHPIRDNIFEEGDACIDLNKDGARIINNQLKFYSKNRASLLKAELIESNFMVIDFNNSVLKEVFYLWWVELNKFSIRDQISLPKVLSEKNLKPHYLLPDRLCVRFSKFFDYYTHLECRNLRYSKQVIRLGSIINPYDVDTVFKKSKDFYDLSSYKDITVDVIVCVHNALSDVEKCLYSVVNSLGKNHKLILVNDASDERTSKFLKKITSENKNIRLITNKKNLGYTASANIGLRSGYSDYKILLNSDTIVSDDWILKFLKVGEYSNDIGVIGPLSNAASYQSLPKIDIKRPLLSKFKLLSSSKNTVINKIPEESLGKINEFISKFEPQHSFPIVPLVHGFCICIKSDVLNKIGYFDEINFKKYYGEENDFCIRATNAGFKMAIASNTFIYHRKSASICDSERTKYMKQSALALRRIYGEKFISDTVLQMRNNPILMLLRKESVNFFARLRN